MGPHVSWPTVNMVLFFFFFFLCYILLSLLCLSSFCAVFHPLPPLSLFVCFCYSIQETVFWPCILFFSYTCSIPYSLRCVSLSRYVEVILKYMETVLAFVTHSFKFNPWPSVLSQLLPNMSRTMALHSKKKPPKNTSFCTQLCSHILLWGSNDNVVQ